MSDGLSPVALGQDGTIYVLAGTRNVQGQYRESVVALDAAGRVKPGWPTEEPIGSGFGTPIMGPNGDIYVDECGATEVGCLLHQFDASGSELPGWPLRLPAIFTCPVGHYCFDRLNFGPDGTAYLSQSSEVGGLQVVAIDAAGKIIPGWPLGPDAARVTWSNAQVGPDGTLFVLSGRDGGPSPTSLDAFGPDGHVRPGWPVAVPSVVGYLPGQHGTVVAWSMAGEVEGLCPNPHRTVFTVLGSDGRALPGWPQGSMGLASGPVIGGDGTIYYSSASGKVYALDRTGEIKAGWPAVVTGSLLPSGCGPAVPYVAPDGSIYVLGDEVEARSPDGSERPGWPYRPDGRLYLYTGDSEGAALRPAPAFGPDGTVYVAVFPTSSTGVGAEIVALDPHGQVEPGWPVRLPSDMSPNGGLSLTVSPDGRLVVESRGDKPAFVISFNRHGLLPT